MWEQSGSRLDQQPRREGFRSPKEVYPPWRAAVQTLRRLTSIKTLAGLCLARLQGFAGEAVAIRESRIAPDSKEYGFSGRPGRIRWVNSTKSNDAVTYVRFRA